MCVPLLPQGGWWLCRVDPARSASGGLQGRLTQWAPHTHGPGREGAGVGGWGVLHGSGSQIPTARVRSTPEPSRWGVGVQGTPRGFHDPLPHHHDGPGWRERPRAAGAAAFSGRLGAGKTKQQAEFKQPSGNGLIHSSGGSAV